MREPARSLDGDGDVSIVLARLTKTGAKGASLAIAAVHHTIGLLCVAAGLTGAVAVFLGVWAWHNSLQGSVIAVAAGAPTVAVAIYVLIRARGLTRAVQHPSQALAQAQDLVMAARGSPELHQLARQVTSRSNAKRVGGGRLRRTLSTGRLISATIGLGSPDPKRHNLLAPFTPARLKFLWLAITVGLWCWLISAVMASIAFLWLAVGLL